MVILHTRLVDGCASLAMASEGNDAAGVDTFARSVGRISCAQILYAQGERVVKSKVQKSTPRNRPAPIVASQIHATRGVADALADILKGFILKIGRESKDRAELAGRTKATLIEVLAVLEKIGHVTKTNIRDLAQYALYEEIPFPKALESFPKIAAPKKRPREKRKLIEDRADLRWPQMETWMPPLPPKHTYVATPVFVEPQVPKDKEVMSVGKQRRQVERSLAILRKRKASAADNALLSASVATGNPYLAPPIVGSGNVIDEEIAGPPREVASPSVGIDAPNDRSHPTTNQNGGARGLDKGPEAKKLRVDRILAESAGL